MTVASVIGVLLRSFSLSLLQTSGKGPSNRAPPDCAMLARISAVASLLQVSDPAASPAARWTRVGRFAAAATLVLGAAFQLASFLTETPNDETVDRLRWVAEHPDRADLVKLFDFLAMPFLLGTALVYVLLSRERSPRLAYAGGILLACGMVGLAAVQGFEILQFALAQDGRFDLTALADAVDDLSTPAGIAMLLLFLVGAFFGLVISTAALWRSRAVPRAAALLIPAFIVVDIFLGMGRLGHAISFAAACWFAWAVLRAESAAARS
jgi:hypothetical protein